MKRFCTAVFLTLLLFTIMGCTTSYKPLSPDTNMTDKTNVSTSDNQAMVNKFTRLAESVSGVKSAAVAITTSSLTNNNGVGTINNNPGTTNPNTTNYNNTTNPNNMYQNNRMNNQNLSSPNTNNIYNNNNRTGTAQSPILRNNYNNTATNTNNREMIVMVGINLESDKAEPNTVSDVAKEVERKIKSSDSQVAQVLVTSNPVSVNKIKSVSNSIMRGTPIENLQNDISDLTRSLSNGNY